MTKERVKELICVILTVVFIVFVTSDTPDSDKTVNEVCDSVIKVMDMNELQERKKNQFKKEFLLNPNDYDGVVYYSSDSVIQVRELLVVRLKNEEQSEQLIENIQKRIEQKITLFKGYSPEEEALLRSYVLENTRGFVLFAVCDNPEQLVQTFKDSL